MIEVRILVTDNGKEEYSGSFTVVKDVTTIDDVDAMLYETRKRVKDSLHRLGVYPKDAQT